MTRTSIEVNCETGEIEEVALPGLALEELKAEKASTINALRDQSFRSGFLVSDTGTALDGHVLQARDIEDRTNWLTSQASYSAAVAAGYGTAQGATFRTASNATIDLTYAQGLNVLLAMAAWGKTVMGKSWSLKDAVAAASDQEELDAIDITAGWP
jgi:hypothetical protein